MKHLKKYESIDEFIDELIYKPGDYILLNIPKIKKNIEDYHSFNNISIKNIPSNKAKITKIINNDVYPYKIIFDTTNKSTSIEQDEIIRKLTPEEINDFKFKKNADKYNL